MSAYVDRPFELEDHPMYDRRYLVPSVPIAEMLLAIKQSIRYGYNGTFFYGHTRWGKSRAMRYCICQLAAQKPRRPIVELTAPDSPSRSESFFWGWLLQATRHKDSESGKVDQKRKRLLIHLSGIIEASGCHLLLFFIDEAQRYELIHWKWMKELQEALERRGYRTCFFLTGQPELMSRQKEFLENNNPEIVARFFSREVHFRGISSAIELKSTLSGYDNSVYPPDTEWTFTRFFVPRAFDAKLRLADHAENLWEAFMRAYKLANFSKDMELPMQNLTRAIEIVLFDAMVHDSVDLEISMAMWNDAVAMSGFIGDLQRLRVIVRDPQFEL